MTDVISHDTDAPAPPLRRWFLLLLLAVVLLHAAGLNPYWRFQRDSPRYMGLARSLAETHTFSFNGQEHIYALPGFPAMLSLVYMGFGENFLAMNALVSLLGVGCVVLGYLLYCELSLTAFQAFACVLLLALSRTLYYYSFQILTDIPFTFFAIGALYFARRMLRAEGGERWAWCAAAAGAAAAACAVRPLGPALFAAMVAALWLRPGARAAWRVNAGLTVVLVTPVLLAGALWAVRGAHLGAPLGTTYKSRNSSAAAESAA